MPNPVTARSFTGQFNQINQVLVSNVKVGQAYQDSSGQFPPKYDFNGLWDTGATRSVITQKIILQCGLKPIDIVKVYHADGECLTNVYLISLFLPNMVEFPILKVTEGKIKNFDLLIGMDIIGAGDFAVTNFGGKTTFSYRYPSIETIDFTGKIPRQPIVNTPKVGPNDPCPCGSGKKYKKCCGDIR